MVLIVDDEPFIRATAEDCLGEAGFDVITATNADNALSVLDARSDVRVVFTDVQMPGTMDGLGLAQKIHERWPRIGVVVTSGRKRPTEASLCDDPFLEKPYSPSTLVREIRESVLRHGKRI
ncbi:response regulator [Methylocapsa palsarum]|uniref:response regulator n=1 Tax=Methylocapsa palsarum TaxID=1612308 RepID=UPI001FCDB54C|nr:response regulator [Methylocapsa palsarum]